MARKPFSWPNFFVRWAVAIVLVLATINTTEWSYVGWALAPGGSVPLKVLAGLVLLILYVVYLRATWRAIGPVGIILSLAFLGTIVWALIDFGVLDPTEPTAMTYVVLLVVATVMAIGLSWSHIRRRVSGQVDTDDVET